MREGREFLEVLKAEKEKVKEMTEEEIKELDKKYKSLDK